MKDKEKLLTQPAAGRRAGLGEPALCSPLETQWRKEHLPHSYTGMERRGKAQGNPNPGLPCTAAGWQGQGSLGGSVRSPGAPRGPGSMAEPSDALPAAAPAALSQPAAPPGWSWKEDRSSFPATIFQVSGDCRRGREERGAGFVCLAQSYALKQITENAAEGSSKAEFGTDKSQGRLSPISDASHVFVFPFPILAFPINHRGSTMGLSLPRANGPERRRGADAPVHGDVETVRE